ncbi:MAG: peroxiredoxin [Myxococcota bacterium]
MIEVNTPFPDFSLPNQDNQVKKLSDYRGSWLVLYVYPQDDTPGCTIQGQSFTATKDDFTALNAKVVGLSVDDVASHKRFCDKFNFTIDLLADPGAKLLKAAGVGQSPWQGVMYWDRTTFLVDPQGILRKVYEKVSPRGHEQTVLQDIRALSK